MGAKVALANGIEERTHFSFFSVNLKFYATVNQVAHPAGDIEPFRYMSNRPAKTDTLNIAFVKYLERDHARDQTDPKKDAKTRKSSWAKAHARQKA